MVFLLLLRHPNWSPFLLLFFGHPDGCPLLPLFLRHSDGSQHLLPRLCSYTNWQHILPLLLHHPHRQRCRRPWFASHPYSSSAFVLAAGQAVCEICAVIPP